MVFVRLERITQMPTLTKKGEWYTWVGDYEDRLLPKQAGFIWSPYDKVWRTKFANKAVNLAAYADESCKAEFNIANTAIEQSSATTADITVPAPPGCTYKPYQLAGIQYALNHKRCIIADAMGLGKSIESLGVINATQAKRVLIVCPAIVKTNWQREAQKWLTPSQPIGIADGDYLPPLTGIVIINYDILERHQTALKSLKWDIVVYDESHKLKNPKAKRTIAALGLRGENGIPSDRVLFLTGTPILNRPVELFPMLEAIDHRKWQFWPFVMRYCAANKNRFGWDFSGASNLTELQTQLRSLCMVRREKADVLKELPPKIRRIIELPTNGSAALVEAEQAAYAAWLGARGEQVKAATTEAEQTLQKDMLELFAQTVEFRSISTTRHELAIAKLPKCIEYITDALENSNKIVVFAHHHDVVSGLLVGLSEFKPVSITGVDSQQQRQAAIDAFQNDNTVRVAVCSIQGAGVGITLTAASHVIFCELDWTPANVSQAEDRCHRIGQTDSVLVEHLVVDGSLDGRMAHLIVEKQNISDQLLNRDMLTVCDTTLTNTPIIESTTPITVKNDVSEDINLTYEQREKVLNGLQMVAGVCDYANRRDDCGFNKYDAAFGHKLACLSQLTPKQAACGLKMLRKYVRQLPAGFLDDLV